MMGFISFCTCNFFFSVKIENLNTLINTDEIEIIKKSRLSSGYNEFSAEFLIKINSKNEYNKFVSSIHEIGISVIPFEYDKNDLLKMAKKLNPSPSLYSFDSTDIFGKVFTKNNNLSRNNTVFVIVSRCNSYAYLFFPGY